jgi:hypothetical protein
VTGYDGDDKRLPGDIDGGEDAGDNVGSDAALKIPDN